MVVNFSLPTQAGYHNNYIFMHLKVSSLNIICILNELARTNTKHLGLHHATMTHECQSRYTGPVAGGHIGFKNCEKQFKDFGTL